jgi:hypothetical protein
VSGGGTSSGAAGQATPATAAAAAAALGRAEGPDAGPSSPIAEEVRRRRKALRLTLRDAAARTGVS